MMLSDRALSAKGLEEANCILAEAGSRRILILGGAHSAYSVAGALLELPAAGRLAAGQIVILQRREPRIFYPDSQAALDDLYDFEPGDICPRTQRVNRMGGLRGYGREMWRQIARRPGTQIEPRVVTMPLQQFTAAQLHAMIEEAALVVPSFGYRSSMLPVFDTDGERLALAADAGGRRIEPAQPVRDRPRHRLQAAPQHGRRAQFQRPGQQPVALSERYRRRDLSRHS